MIRREPLSFYVNKLERREPFSSLLYGDGEFLVASRRRTGRTMQGDELVTPALEDELRQSFAVTGGPPIYRGTDPFLADPDSYGGRDIESVRQSARALTESIPPGLPPFDWYDGTVWDSAVRDGELGPLIRGLNRRRVAVVGNARLVKALPFTNWGGSVVPETNACANLDQLTEELSSTVEDFPLVVCMGVGAIPLIMRLRKINPFGTYLDLGSTFDVFARIGVERGWRQELYADEAKWRAMVNKNLEGAR